MEDCIFCKMVKGEIPCRKVYEDTGFLAFLDINPQAPVHVLVIPKKHVARLSETVDRELLGSLLSIASAIAERENISGKGYRIVINTGREAGQTVDHIHLHLLGGRKMNWPPG